MTAMTAALLLKGKMILLAQTPWGAAVVGSLLGVSVDLTGFSHAGSTAVFVALCGLAGAFFASLPKIISARSIARMSESEYVGREMHSLIETLKKNASDNARILALSTNVRHTVQSSYQAAIWHIDHLEQMLHNANVQNVPKISVLDVAALLKEFDRDIIAIKSTPLPDA